MNTVDVAWHRYLRAEYTERQCRSWAPSRLEAATKERYAAARALMKMGVDISTMRCERLDVAAVLMAEHLASMGVQALVERRGARLVMETIEPTNIHEGGFAGFEKWALARGIWWTSSHFAKKGIGASHEFYLVSPGQETWVVPHEVGASHVSEPPETEDVFRARAPSACSRMAAWWAAEGITVMSAPSETDALAGVSSFCIILESRENIDWCDGTSARFTQWLKANGLKAVSWGSNDEIRSRVMIVAGERTAEPVRADHLDSKIETAWVDVGRATIAHALPRPTYQQTSRERFRELAKLIASASCKEAP